MEEKSINTVSAECNVPFAQYDGLRVEYEDRLDDVGEKFDKRYDKMVADKNTEIDRWKKMCFRLWGVLLAIVVSIFLLGAYVLTCFDFSYESYDYSQDATDGNTNFIGNNGDIYGEPTN